MDINNNSLETNDGSTLCVNAQGLNQLSKFSFSFDNKVFDSFIERVACEEPQLIHLHGDLEYFSKLSTIDTTHLTKYWTNAGGQLEDLQTAYSGLLGLYPSNAEWPFEATETLIEPAGPTVFPDSFEELNAFINDSQELQAITQTTTLLRWIVDRVIVDTLLKYISKKIRELKKLLYCVGRRFCGLTWSGRIWGILHGSHPPKSEPWQINGQAFGCV
jgi:hypothetical protein